MNTPQWLKVILLSLCLWAMPMVVLAQDESQPEWLEVSLELRPGCELQGKPANTQIVADIPVFPLGCEVAVTVTIHNHGDMMDVFGADLVHYFDALYLIRCLEDGEDFLRGVDKASIAECLGDADHPEYALPIRDTSTSRFKIVESAYPIVVPAHSSVTKTIVYLTGFQESLNQNAPWELEVCVYGSESIWIPECIDIDFHTSAIPTAEESVDQPTPRNRLFLPFMSS